MGKYIFSQDIERTAYIKISKNTEAEIWNLGLKGF